MKNSAMKVAQVSTAAEATIGNFVATAAPIFPVNDLEIPTPDLALSEYGRPANGTTKRGKMLSGAQTFAFGFTSFMNPIAGTPKTIINKNLYTMAGWRYREVTGFPEVYFDNVPVCSSFSWTLTTLGCYDSADDTPTGNQWNLRGMKTEFTIGAGAVGEPVIMTCSAQSAIEGYNPDGETSSLSAHPDFDGIAVDRFLGATVEMGGADIDAQSWLYTQGNVIEFTTDASKATITRAAHITDADPKLQLTAYVGTTTAGIWTQASGNIPVGDVVVTGQLYTYTFLDCMVSSYKEEDANGILVLSLELSVRGGSAIRSKTAVA